MENTIVSIVIILMYFLSGIDKMMHFTKVYNGFVARTHVPVLMAKIAISIAILIEIICPILIVLSTKYFKFQKYGIYSCYALLLFTIIATAIYHFPPVKFQWYPFISNVTSCGALYALSLIIKKY